MANEGVVIFQKICSLKNPVQLKLALICGQTCHHICKDNSFGFDSLYMFRQFWVYNLTTVLESFILHFVGNLNNWFKL